MGYIRHVTYRASTEDLEQLEKLAPQFGGKTAAIKRGLELLAIDSGAQNKTPEI